MIQTQPFRYTDCRCMFETYWDVLAMVIFLIFAAAGFFWFMEATFKTIDRWSKSPSTSTHPIKKMIISLIRFIE